MAATGNNQKTSVTYRIFHDADAEEQDNVAGGSCSLYSAFIHNADSNPVWLKLYDAVDPTYGTTAPSHIFRIEATSREVFTWPAGLAFSTALSYSVVTTNSTGGTSHPSSAAALRLVTS